MHCPSLLPFATVLGLICLLGVEAKIGVFEAMNRKEWFWAGDVKTAWAQFDAEGIMTFNGNLNGRSNDLVFPNAAKPIWAPQACDKKPQMMFQICVDGDDEKRGPWTGLAICYESQLSREKIHPFFRVQIDPAMERLVFLICGEAQNALFVNRTGKPGENGRGFGKFDPYYFVYSSMRPKQKLFFKMPDKQSSKQCVLLQIGGGGNLVRVRVTDLHRKEIPLFMDDLRTKWNPGDGAHFIQEFPDMANRNASLVDSQSLSLLLLDFLPPLNSVQNVSVYGWLPVKVKLLSKSISPCRVDWKLVESRSIRGVKGALTIMYHLKTGTTVLDQSSRAGEAETKEDRSKTEDREFGLSGGAQIKRIALNFGYENNFKFTQGATSEGGTDFNVVRDLSEAKTKTRDETVSFNQFEGTVNVEQMVFTCNGVAFFPDKIRYADEQGRELVPDSVQSGEQILASPALRDAVPKLPETCFDEADECRIWAGEGQCRSKPSFMLTYCKESCKLCTKVTTNKDSNAEDLLPLVVVDEKCEDFDRFLCKKWANEGACSKDPASMSRSCRRSCGLCKSAEDEDYAAEQALAQKRHSKRK